MLALLIKKKKILKKKIGDNHIKIKFVIININKLLIRSKGFLLNKHFLILKII